MKCRVENVLALTHILDLTMPGLKSMLPDWNKYSGKDTLADFAYEYWHFDNITKKIEKQFINSHLSWTRKKDTDKTRRKQNSFMLLRKTVSQHYRPVPH